MYTLSLVNDLLSTPLFQGMSRTDMQEILNLLRPNVSKRSMGSTIVRADSPCNKLIIVLTGKVKVTTISTDRSYHLTEVLSAPLVLQAEHLFGRRMMYSSTFRAAAPCTLITFTKRDFLALYNEHEVFRLNLLNTLVVRIEKTADRDWACAHLSLPQRIVQFIARHSSYPAGEKWLKITMNDLAAELNTSRLNVSAALNSLAQSGCITLSRGMIYVPALEKLYNIS